MHQAVTIADVELLKNLVEMRLHRALADRQMLRDLRVAKSVGDASDDFSLARSEPSHWKISLVREFRLQRRRRPYEAFRNRGRWHEYQVAIEDMVEKTSTRRAPWHLIPANNKPFGRLAALRIIADRLSKGVSLEPRPLDPAVADAAAELLGIRLPTGNHARAAE